MFDYSDHSELNQDLHLLLFCLDVDSLDDAIATVTARFENIDIKEVLIKWRAIN